MHTEAEIRKAIKPLLDKYGELNTSEVKQLLHEVLVYDDDDKIMSETRNEMKIIQRIGNIVAHQKEKKRIYEEGFIVDKNYSPAKFIAITGVKNDKKPLSKDKIEERKKMAKFIGKKVDWGKKRERDEDIGNMGEEFIYEYEKDRVKSFDSTSVDRVSHLSRLQGDGLGYDISSINDDGTTRRIEVKTTTGGIETPFYMSRNEKLFFETYRHDGAFIYRVYNFNKSTRRGKLKIITADKLLNDYVFDPVTFAVTKK